MSKFNFVRRDRASALISALAIVAMSTLLLSGVIVLAGSHSERQSENANYTMALQLADAGINYELNYATKNHAAHLSSAPYAGSVTGASGTFSVYVTNQDGTTNYTPGNPMTVVSTGTVNGVVRKVSINASAGGGTSIFNPATGDSGGVGGGFAVFGLSTVQFTQASSVTNGDLGTNGAASVNNNGNGNVNGNIVLDGPSATAASINNRGIVHNGSAMVWPTVDTVCASLIPGGWSGLTSSAAIANQTARMRTYTGNSPVMTFLTTKSTGWSNKTSISSSDVSALNVSTLILQPGDYYFTDFNVTNNNLTVIFDTAGITCGVVPQPGPIHIWMNNSTNADAINCQFSFTLNNDPTLFRIYYNKPTNITLAGNMTYYGGLYGVRSAGTSATHATITVGANSKVTGYLIADDVILTGGAVVTNAVGNPSVATSSDYQTGSANYAYSNSWKELAINAGAVFTDGSNN